MERQPPKCVFKDVVSIGRGQNDSQVEAADRVRVPSAGGDPESRLGALHDPRAGAKHSPFQTSPDQELNQLKIRLSNVTKQFTRVHLRYCNFGNGIGINIIWCIYLNLNIFLPDKSSILS